MGNTGMPYVIRHMHTGIARTHTHTQHNLHGQRVLDWKDSRWGVVGAEIIVWDDVFEGIWCEETIRLF